MKISKTKMRELNQRAGFHFFDKDTMSFFNSEIETVPEDESLLFITSERREEDFDKKYTIRRFNPEDYSVDTNSDFQEFNTLEIAKVWMKIRKKEINRPDRETFRELKANV